VRNIVIIGAVALYLLNLAGSASAVEKGRTVRDKIISSSLEVNLIGNPTTKPLVIYLPPGYDELPDQRYPVIYHLHGAIRLSGGAEKFAQAHKYGKWYKSWK
jgi:hypothetical protein